jgi:hypothetical protein
LAKLPLKAQISIFAGVKSENEMAKQSGHKGSRRIVHLPLPPKLKLFRPVNWYSGATIEPVGEYVPHILRELGRLSLEVHDMERHDRSPNTNTILSDLIGWLSDGPGEAFAKLFNWQTLDAGFKVDAGDVRRIRQLIEHYNPEILPEELRPASLTMPAAPLSSNNVVPLRGDDSR